jgi:hypothetical protein
MMVPSATASIRSQAPGGIRPGVSERNPCLAEDLAGGQAVNGVFNATSRLRLLDVATTTAMPPLPSSRR